MKYVNLFFIISLMIFSSCNRNSFPVKEVDSRGKEIIIEKKPERIIALAPSHSEILYALGLEDRIIGITNSCNCPHAEKKEKVGGFNSIDVKKIVQLKPDLVLALGTIQLHIIPLLEKEGIKVFWLYPKNYEEILDSYNKIGVLTGSIDKAVELRQGMERRINSVIKKLEDIPPSKRPKILRVMGTDPLGSIGNLNFQNDIYSLAGGRNIYSDVKKDYFIIDTDDLLKRDPEVIVICGEDRDKNIKTVLSHPVLKKTKAAKEGRILSISCDLICRPGAHIAEAVEAIASYIHSDRISTVPKRIISLNPGITEELYLLNSGELLIANTFYCDRPPEAKSKIKIGNIINFDIERVLSLKPDIVLATTLASSRKISLLRRSGVRVEEFPQAKNFKELCDNFTNLGRIIGKGKQGEMIINRLNKAVVHINTAVKSGKSPRIFMQIGAKPLVTVNKNSFLNDLIHLSGGINIAENNMNLLYSREGVLFANPDAIIITDMGRIGNEEKRIWQRFKTINAVKNNKILVVDSDIFCTATPNTFLEALKETATFLHPEEMKDINLKEVKL